MYTPHSVTVYNTRENDDMTMEYNVTVLSGVFLDVSQGDGLSKTGANSSDVANLYIPFSVSATDADTGEEKQFISPKEYSKLEDTAGYWTLEASGEASGASCYFIKGTYFITMDYGELREAYDDVYNVTNVRTYDYGSADMQHWEVNGR